MPLRIAGWKPPRCDYLLVSTADNIGGMERIVCGLARQFSAQGRAVRTVFPRTERSGALLTWCHEQGVPAEVTPAVRNAAASHTTRDILGLRALIRSAGPQVVNLHYGDNFISLKDVLAVRLAGRYRCVVTVHHPTPWDVTNRRKRQMTRLAAALADAVVVVSDATRQVVLGAGVPPQKVHMVPCGVWPPAHTPTREAARQRLGVPAGAFVVSTLGRLVPHKGVQDLIQACGQMDDPGDDLHLLVAGDGPERSALEAAASSVLGSRARFLGRVPDTADVYAAADVFALPSYMEGFGLVYVEAAFHGVPSVGTTVGGIPDAVVDGQTGLLVPVGDPGALATALSRLWNDPEWRLQLGLAACRRAHAEFTEAIMARRYARLFDCVTEPASVWAPTLRRLNSHTLVRARE